jgi:acetyl-CoA C-acetyltransferase
MLFTAARGGFRLGDNKVEDGLMLDGLTDAYGKYPMGNCAEVSLFFQFLW